MPSKIQYVGDQPTGWGYAAEDEATAFSWFKLMLDYKDLPANIKNSSRVREICSKLVNWDLSCGDPILDAMKVTTDYLKLLWEHSLRIIIQEQGQRWAIGMPCKVVITRPAIWSQEASARTRKVAEDAILDNARDFESVTISLVSEPEAAAHAVLQAPSVARRPELTQVSRYTESWLCY